MNPNKYLILSTLICLAGFLIVSILVETDNMTRHFPSGILAGFFLSGAIFSAGIIVPEYAHDRCNLPDR